MARPPPQQPVQPSGPQPAQQGIDARAAAVNTLDAVLRKGVALDEALSQSRALAALEPRDRAFARMMVATTLRRLGQIDRVIAAFLKQPLPDRAGVIHNILRLGAAQLLLLETPAHAVVDNAVRLCVVVRQQGFKGLVNAVLRRISAEGKAVYDSASDPAHNVPDWLWKSWSETYGDETARAIATAHLAEPPLDLTVRDDPAGWAARLGGEALPGGTIRLRGAGEVSQIEGFADGAWWVQDVAAALPARLLLSALAEAPGGISPDKSIVDLCAAPGGKTIQLALSGATVTAVDRSGTRLVRLRQNLHRMGVTAQIFKADASKWQPAETYDAVLLDAPCSSTGTIRRHPDIAWNKKPEDVTRLAALQDKLLQATATMLKPGGILVYSVCSLQPEEGPARIDALLSATDDFERLPVTAAETGGLPALLTADGDIRTLPNHLADQGGMDGFFIARLKRRA
jgi:16S rRNA (cytosine967-C5)-methyltransferase